MPDPEQGDIKIEKPEDVKAQDEIVVDLEKKTDDGAQKQEKKQREEDEISKMSRRMEYQARQFEKGLKQIQDIAQKISSVSPTAKSETDIDDLDKVAEQDWKKAVDILAERRAKIAIEDYRQEQDRLIKERQTQDELALSKARVLQRHPDLEDESSDKAKSYIQIINENPHFLQNPYGPELAMYRMEEKLRSKAHESTPSSIDLEISRRQRVSQSSMPQGQKPSSQGKVVLTSDEQAYCQRNSIPYEQFARMKMYDQKSLKEGVSVQ